MYKYLLIIFVLFVSCKKETPVEEVIEPPLERKFDIVIEYASDSLLVYSTEPIILDSVQFYYESLFNSTNYNSYTMYFKGAYFENDSSFFPFNYFDKSGNKNTYIVDNKWNAVYIFYGLKAENNLPFRIEKIFETKYKFENNYTIKIISTKIDSVFVVFNYPQLGIRFGSNQEISYPTNLFIDNDGNWFGTGPIVTNYRRYSNVFNDYIFYYPTGANYNLNLDQYGFWAFGMKKNEFTYSFAERFERSVYDTLLQIHFNLNWFKE